MKICHNFNYHSCSLPVVQMYNILFLVAYIINFVRLNFFGARLDVEDVRPACVGKEMCDLIISVHV